MIEVLVPRENVNDDSVVVRTIHVKSGDFINKGQLIVEIETSKTNIDIESPEAGLISHNLELGAEVDIGELLFCVGSQEPRIQMLEGIEHPPPESSNIKISKAAAKRAKELDVDVTKLGIAWISTKDIERKAGLTTTKLNSTPTNEDDFNDLFGFSVPAKKESLSKRKQVEIRNLQMGKHQSTSSTIGIDITVPAQRIVPPPFLFQNSISDLIVYEGSRLLKKYPELNSAFIDSKTWGKYDDINFGWSFDSGANLKVLAIKDSDKCSLIDLQNEVIRLLDLYESNQNIPMELLTSSTVTISDLSKTDASFILPLINGFQSLILGVVKKNKNCFSIYATFDHRVSEGLKVTNFLSELKSRILSYYLDQNGIATLVCHACEKTMAEEISLGNRGFIKITLPNGEEASLCHNCFSGI
jgi:pyruvate/2-oxoglutarate dehydrogenase complex dihydrolipoamide acyltransferase (E2) component